MPPRLQEPMGGLDPQAERDVSLAAGCWDVSSWVEHQLGSAACQLVRAPGRNRPLKKGFKIKDTNLGKGPKQNCITSAWQWTVLSPKPQ